MPVNTNHCKVNNFTVVKNVNLNLQSKLNCIYLFICLSVHTVTTIWKRDKSFSVVTVVTAKMCYLRKEHATGAAP